MDGPDAPVLSSEARIGRILLLLGGLVALFMGLMMLVMMAMPMWVTRSLTLQPALIMFAMVGFMGLLGIAGFAVALVGYNVAPRDVQRAGILGVVATVLPPTNLIVLAGGILLLLSPEGKRAQTARQAPSRH